MNDPCKHIHSSWGLDQFKSAYPSLRWAHQEDCGIEIDGNVNFRAVAEGFEPLEDTYELHICVPRRFPSDLPRVFETGDRIPKNFHTNSDGALCLGSPLRQRILLESNKTLSGFVELLLIPYLYNYSHYLLHGSMPTGELAHGSPGLIADYERIFSIKGPEACLQMLYLLGKKRREANKFPCPCESGRRFGKCHNVILNPLREIESRRYYVVQAGLLHFQIDRERKHS